MPQFNFAECNCDDVEDNRWRYANGYLIDCEHLLKVDEFLACMAEVGEWEMSHGPECGCGDDERSDEL